MLDNMHIQYTYYMLIDLCNNCEYSFSVSNDTFRCEVLQCRREI